MKRYLWKLLAFVVILLAESCSKDNSSEDIPVNPNEPNEITKDIIVATFDNNECNWSAGDKIAVLAKGISEPFELKEGENTPSAKFEGKLPTKTIGVAFPYTNSCSPEISSDDVLNMQLSGTIENITKCNLPMWAKLEGKNARLKPLTGILSISLKGVPSGYNSLTLKSSNVVSGPFEADLSQDEIVLMPKENNTLSINKLLNVKFDATTDSDNDRNISLPLPVGVYSNIQILIGKNGEAEEVLLDWGNKMITLGQVYNASTTYGNSDTPTKVNEILKDVLNEADTAESPTQVNLTNCIVADENPITIPTAKNGKTSNITLNFQKAPETSEKTPLKIEQNAEGKAGKATNKLTLVMPQKANIKNLAIKAPTSTATLMGGTYSKLTASTATNTLIIGSNTVIEHLIVTSGNVRIQNGGKITGSITNETGGSITIILENGATEENALPSGFTPKSDIQIAKGWEFDILQYLNAEGEYEIGNAEGLYAIAEATYSGEYFKGKNIKLTKDIDFMGGVWTSMRIFMGTFDGQGHTIKNAIIQSNEISNNEISFFGCIGSYDEHACVKNLTFEKCQISVTEENTTAAILARYAYSSVINCHSKNCKITISKDGCMVGGLVGTLYGTMMACTSNTEIISTAKKILHLEIGGLIRHSSPCEGKMVGCAYTGNITTGEFELLKDEKGNEGTFHIGGLACLPYGAIYGCYFGGNISGGQYVGALCGQLNNQTVLSDCYYNGSYNYVGNYFSIKEENINVGNFSYETAINHLNSGIATYNQSATIPCNYRFVKGSTPKLEAVK